jgi:ADP-heptose:LPS heptosyltransferase
MQRPKILLFKLGLLGDVLMTTPFVRQLRRIFPHAEIQYWVGKSYKQALEGNPHLSTVACFDEQIFFRHDLFQILKLQQKLRKERFDIGFFLGKHWAFNASALSLGISTRVGFSREPVSEFLLTHSVTYSCLRHEMHYYLDLLEFFGIPDFSDTRMEVQIPPETEEWASKTLAAKGLHEFVGIINSGGNNAGENQFVRRLPDQFFKKLVIAVSENYSVVLLGNRVDGAHYSSFTFPENVHNLAGALSFQESLAVMKRASRVYTTDCGGMHMAAAVNDHLTAFFGPAHPRRKAPLIPDIEIVWPDDDQYHPQYDLYNSQPNKQSFQKLAYTFAGQTIDYSLGEPVLHLSKSQLYE